VKVVLADYGAGNVRSVCAAFARAGVDAVVARDAAAVRDADLAVVAGVGRLARAVRGLDARGLTDALRARVAAGRPLLGICVGMQVLFEESEEGGCGLGLLQGPVRRLRASRVPHMGWNALRVRNGSRLLAGLDGADVYFAHSYACEPSARELVTAETDHDGRIVAAIEGSALAGVQFHPERSGAAGAAVLRNTIAWSRSG
jgi:imidazole glycerol-phosphate synthase subunit HisH